MQLPAVDVDRLTRLFGLAGRVALVTGARHGLGRAVALGLAGAGARVVLTSRDPEQLRELGAELDALGAEHRSLALELTDASQIAPVVEAAAARWGRLDVVVNNAGVSIRKAAVDYSAGDWDSVFDVNLRAPFLVAQAAAGVMGADGGRIINISSTMARAAAPRRAPYAASKAGLEHLTRALALEWAARKITVNAIAPGATLTDTRRDVLGREEDRKARIREIPLGRLGVAEDVVGAVLLLAGEAGSFITGQTVVVDGGFTVGRA